MSLHDAARLASVVTLALLLGGLAGCNTVAGAGKDIQSAGEAVEEAAD